jgi:hypothetical protein
VLRARSISLFMNPRAHAASSRPGTLFSMDLESQQAAFFAAYFGHCTGINRRWAAKCGAQYAWDYLIALTGGS